MEHPTRMSKPWKRVEAKRKTAAKTIPAIKRSVGIAGTHTQSTAAVTIRAMAPKHQKTLELRKDKKRFHRSKWWMSCSPSSSLCSSSILTNPRRHLTQHFVSKKTSPHGNFVQRQLGPQSTTGSPGFASVAFEGRRHISIETLPTKGTSLLFTRTGVKGRTSRG